MNGKTLKQGLMGLALMAGLQSSAHALLNPDTIVVSVTPGGLTYGVAITSPMAQGYVFGTVALGATTISTVAISVNNTGNVAEFFAMKVSNTSPDNWAPVGVTPTTDNFQMLAYINATQPGTGTFADSLTNSITTGQSKYGQSTTPNPPSTPKNLWLKLLMPVNVTGTGGAQTMTVFINGQPT